MASFIENYTTVANWVKPFSRTDSFPLDRSSIFGSYADALNYAKGDGTDIRELGKTSYIGQILTVYETDTTKVYVINETRTLTEITNQSPSSDTWATKTYVDNVVTGLFKFKGSAESLPTTDNSEGDVWNITGELELKGIKYPSGTNFVWVVDKDTKVGHWDALGGVMDLSGYMKTPTKGTTGQILTKTDNGYGWEDAPQTAEVSESDNVATITAGDNSTKVYNTTAIDNWLCWNEISDTPSGDTTE